MQVHVHEWLTVYATFNDKIEKRLVCLIQVRYPDTYKGIGGLIWACPHRDSFYRQHNYFISWDYIPMKCLG